MTYKFVGTEGRYVAGVPMRDLTDAEAKAYGVTKSPLYKKTASKSG